MRLAAWGGKVLGVLGPLHLPLVPSPRGNPALSPGFAQSPRRGRWKLALSGLVRQSGSWDKGLTLGEHAEKAGAGPLTTPLSGA